MARLAACWTLLAVAWTNGCPLVDKEAQSELTRGIELANAGDHAAAIVAFDRAVELKEDYAEAHFRCGLARCAEANYALALFSHQHAVRLKPDYAPYLFARGLAYLGDEQYDAAAKDFQEARQQNPGNALQSKIDEMIQLAAQTQQQRGAMGFVGTVINTAAMPMTEKTWVRNGFLGRSDWFARHPAWSIVIFLVAHLFGANILLGIWLAGINGMGRNLSDGEKAGITFVSLIIGAGSYFLAWGTSYWGLWILCTLWTIGFGGNVCKSAPRMRRP